VRGCEAWEAVGGAVPFGGVLLVCFFVVGGCGGGGGGGGVLRAERDKEIGGVTRESVFVVDGSPIAGPVAMWP